MSPEGNVRVILFAEDAVSSVDVENEIVAVPLSPTDLVIVKAPAVTIPTAGMLT